MSFFSVLIGGLAVPKYVTIANSTDRHVLLTATKKENIKVIAAQITNFNGGTVLVRIDHYEAKTATYFRVWVKQMANYTTETFAEFPIAMADGDQITAVGDLNVTVGLAYVTDVSQQR